MKYITLVTVALLLSLSANAQTINIHKKNGEVIKFNSSEVEYVDFTYNNPEENPEQGITSIVGKWVKVYQKETIYKQTGADWSLVEETEERFEDKDHAYGFEFFADGSANLLIFYTDGTEEKESDDNFKYKVEDDTLYLLEEDPEDTDGWESLGTIKFTDEGFELLEDDISEGEREVIFSIYHRK